MKFPVVLTPGEDGYLVVECPTLPGCVTQGKDEGEALAGVKEAIRAWLWAEDKKAAAGIPEDARSRTVVITV